MTEVENQMLIDLVTARGVPGNEEEVREVFVKYAKEEADDIYQDGLGSIIARKDGPKDAPKIMFAGHLDEVGFMVSRITDEGFIKFQTLGGWWSQVMLGHQVEIKNSTNDLIKGVIGCKPPHVLTKEARETPYKIEDMFIDIGASSKEEVTEWGVRPGDMIVPYSPYQRLNQSKFLMAKAWDNRIGLAVALEVLKNIKKEELVNTIYATGNVQEEVGLRGAKTSSNLIEADLSFALDTGTAGDTPGMTPAEADSKLGEGPQIIIYDASMVAHKGLRDFVVNIAEELEIPFQYTVITGGGTDAGSQHLSGHGVPSLAITVPTRYLHSHSSVIHEDDFKNTVKLVEEVIRRLDKEAVNKIIYK